MYCAELQVLSYFHQFFAAAESSMPNVPLMNFEKALNADPTSYFNAEVAFGEKSAEPARIQFKVRYIFFS
jgi:hypothetical protein